MHAFMRSMDMGSVACQYADYKALRGYQGIPITNTWKIDEAHTKLA